MLSKRIILIGAATIGLTAVGFAAYSKSRLVGLKVGVSKISLDWPSTRNSLFTRLYLNMAVTVTNPSPIQVTVASAKASVSYQGKTLATVTKGDQFTIAPSANSIITVSMGIDTLNVFTNIQDAITQLTSKQPIYLSCAAQFNLPAGTVNVNQNLNISL